MESAACDALDSLGCSVHGDATDIDIKTASLFVCGKGDVPDIYTKPRRAIGSCGNPETGPELNTAILFLHLENFATPRIVACKQRAEWTFSPKPPTWGFRPNL
jgi:hypothetical protein